jgi:cytochrome c biogenesis protein CcmG/thiol:disulfide interchange protein DsbE
MAERRRRAAAALAALVAAFAVAAPASAIPRPGDPAPAFSLATANGKTIDSAALRGKPVYLNFFATWCGPCRVETPGIVALSKKYAPRGLRVVGIDVGESAAQALGFAHDFDVPYTLAVDPGNATRASYGGGLYFPLHVFIDAHGIVRFYHPGEMSAAEIDAAIRRILPGPSSAGRSSAAR